MLNSVDYYKTVKGSYKNVTKNRNITVDFNVNLGENSSSHVNIMNSDGSKKKEVISDNDTVLEINEVSKFFTKDNKTKVKDIKLESIRESKNDKQERQFVYRADPTGSQDAQIVIFPQQIAFWLNDDEKNYSIVGNEKYLERDTTIIQGTLNSTISQKLGNNFKMWVDTKTGVLLKLLTFNQSQQEVSRIEVLNIEFDTLQDKFKSGYLQESLQSVITELESKGFTDQSINQQ